jgi:hypothetical protein
MVLFVIGCNRADMSCSLLLEIIAAPWEADFWMMMNGW